MAVSFKEVTKRFADGTTALDRLSLDFDLGEFIVLLGPSGSGKTTACRILAGLEAPSSGCIEIEGKDVTDVPPRFRGIGMVFQNYALYSHKSVFENIAYPLRIRKVPAAEIQRQVKGVADLLRIGDYLHRKPAQLSGGQAQRVAVARALVWEPAICLMDEPLSNLDALLRLHMRTELNRLHRRLEKTFVFVTHDQEEAMTLASRIAVLRDGKLVQFDEPRAIYRRPANRFVAEFMGRPAMNTIDGMVEVGHLPRWRHPVRGRLRRWTGNARHQAGADRICGSQCAGRDDAHRGREGSDRAGHAADLPERRQFGRDAQDTGQL